MDELRHLAGRVKSLSRDLGIGFGIFAAVALAIALDRATPALSVFDALGFGSGHPGRWFLLVLSAGVFAVIFAVNMHFARSMLVNWRSVKSGTDPGASLHERRMVPAKAVRGAPHVLRR